VSKQHDPSGCAVTGRRRHREHPPLLVDIPPMATVNDRGFVKLPSSWLDDGDRSKFAPTLIAIDKVRRHWPELARQLAEDGECVG
jgi:hypothetical protein